MNKHATVDDYIASASPEVRERLEQIRSIVKRVAPDAVETISYQMPAFKEGRVFVYFAAFKKHIGIYPPVHGDEDLQERLLPYRGEKGNLRFPLSQPMPFDLIEDLVEALHKEYAK